MQGRAQQQYTLHCVLGKSTLFVTCEAYGVVTKKAVLSIDALPYISCRQLYSVLLFNLQQLQRSQGQQPAIHCESAASHELVDVPTCDEISMLSEVSADAIHDSTDVARCDSVEPPGLLFRLFRSLPAE